MEDDLLIKVDDVSKKYCKDFKKSLWYGVNDIFNEAISKKIDREILRQDEFWALRNINFELRRGEALGVIGKNGSGKSTLLKIVYGILKPDAGVVKINGSIGALIDMSVGFNPVLTGRENIYIKGQILGFEKHQIDEKFDEIVDFSEIGEFLDTAVQNYSSGMKVRLGFAINSQLTPDILIIDEVLAVGDLEFKIKSFKRIRELQKETAIILVSHNLYHIRKLCTDVLLLHKGVVEYYPKNEPIKAIERYVEKVGLRGDNITDEEIPINLERILPEEESKEVNNKNKIPSEKVLLNENNENKSDQLVSNIDNDNKVSEKNDIPENAGQADVQSSDPDNVEKTEKMEKKLKNPSIAEKGQEPAAFDIFEILIKGKNTRKVTCPRHSTIDIQLHLENNLDRSLTFFIKVFFKSDGKIIHKILSSQDGIFFRMKKKKRVVVTIPRNALSVGEFQVDVRIFEYQGDDSEGVEIFKKPNARILNIFEARGEDDPSLIRANWSL